MPHLKILFAITSQTQDSERVGEMMRLWWWWRSRTMTRCGDSAQDSGSLQLLGPLPRNYTASPRHDAHNGLWQSSLLTKRESSIPDILIQFRGECLISSLPPSPRPNHSVTRDNWDTPCTKHWDWATHLQPNISNVGSRCRSPAARTRKLFGQRKCQSPASPLSTLLHTCYHQSLSTPTHDTKGGSLHVVRPLVFLTQRLLVLQITVVISVVPHLDEHQSCEGEGDQLERHGCDE